jgi:hypothetical protein
LSVAAAVASHTALARALVLVSVILATTLYATTLTIANVALPADADSSRRNQPM